MTMSNQSREVRSRLVEVLRRELMGPTAADEKISEFPTSRYLVGRLAPARMNESDRAAAVDEAENDTLALGGGDGEDGAEDASPPLIIAFNPSSFGLSFLVDASEGAITAKVAWGDYHREKGDGENSVWRRHQREVRVEGID